MTTNIIRTKIAVSVTQLIDEIIPTFGISDNFTMSHKNVIFSL